MEKPAWRETFSNRVNSGIYFLSRRVLATVPAGRFYDFSKDLFPRLLRDGVPIRTYAAEGYWCDVGSPTAFRDCNLHFSGGETVRGENVVLGPNSRAEGSVLFSGVRTGERCVLEGCVVCENAVLGSGVQVPAGRGRRRGGAASRRRADSSKRPHRAGRNHREGSGYFGKHLFRRRKAASF